MKSKKYLIIAVLLILLLWLFSHCGDSKHSIVGQWESTGEKSIFYNSVEFFSDGTYITETQSWSGTYSIDGNRLKLSGKLYGEVFSFKLSDNENQLTLTNSLGYSKTYTRVKR